MKQDKPTTPDQDNRSMPTVNYLPADDQPNPNGGPLPHLSGQWPNSDEFTVPVEHGNFLIGRAPDCDLAAPMVASFVSSRHVELQQTPAGYAVVDLNSTNGTRLNDQPLTPQEATLLKDGDIIRMGSKRSGSFIELTFHAPATE